MAEDEVEREDAMAKKKSVKGDKPGKKKVEAKKLPPKLRRRPRKLGKLQPKTPRGAELPAQEEVGDVPLEKVVGDIPQEVEEIIDDIQRRQELGLPNKD